MKNKTTIRYSLILSIVIAFALSASGQSGTWKYGFELGWTHSKTIGDVELNSSNEAVESEEFNSGFHLSFYARRYFTDLFGIQFGLAYAQRGGQRNFDGNSYYIFNAQGEQPRIVNGIRRESFKINNGYLDIPVLAFHQLGDKFEVGGGAYLGFLVASKSDGEIRMQNDGVTSNFETFFVNTEYDYLSDEFGDATLGTQDVMVSGQSFTEPRTIQAYYEYLEDPGEDLYKRFDYGLLGQVGFYFNNSLNLKGRLMYGLADLTNEEADVSKANRDGQTLVFREDNDNSLSIQVSLGFVF